MNARDARRRVGEESIIIYIYIYIYIIRARVCVCVYRVGERGGRRVVSVCVSAAAATAAVERGGGGGELGADIRTARASERDRAVCVYTRRRNARGEREREMEAAAVLGSQS